MKNPEKKAEIAFLVFVVVMLVCQHWQQAERFPNYDRQTEQQLREYVDTNRTYAISDQQAVRQGASSDMDATEQYLYLKYSSSQCVDVHSLDGEFLYAFLLPDVKGGISLRCVGNQVYIQDACNTLYIFEGREEIARFDYEEASARGYDFFWFQEKNDFQKKEGRYFYKYDENGNCILQVEIPRNTIKVNPLRLLIFLTALGITLRYVISDILRR